jgi:hypothetical protein
MLNGKPYILGATTIVTGSTCEVDKFDKFDMVLRGQGARRSSAWGTSGRPRDGGHLSTNGTAANRETQPRRSFPPDVLGGERYDTHFTDDTLPALSAFLKRYLSGRHNPSPPPSQNKIPTRAALRSEIKRG